MRIEILRRFFLVHSFPTGKYRPPVGTGAFQGDRSKVREKWGGGIRAAEGGGGHQC